MKGQTIEERQAALLFNRAQAGDHEAFGRLLNSFRPRLEVQIRLRLGSRLRIRVDPEDVLQETYLKAFQLRSRFVWQGSSSFVRWLGCIARHAIGNLARRNKDLRRQVRLPSRGSSGGGPPGVEDWGVEGSSASLTRRTQRYERLERLARALRALPPDRRKVVVYALLEGLPTREISRRMNRQPGAVNVLLYRALRQLRKNFGDTESLNLPSRSLSRGSLVLTPSSPPGSKVRRRGYRPRKG